MNATTEGCPTPRRPAAARRVSSSGWTRTSGGLSDTGDDSQTHIFRAATWETGLASVFPADLRKWRGAVALAGLIQEVLGLPAAGAAPSDGWAIASVVVWCLATGRPGSEDMAALCHEEPMCRYLGGGRAWTCGEFQQWRREHRSEVVAALAALLTRCAPVPVVVAPEAAGAEALRRLDLARSADHFASDD